MVYLKPISAYKTITVYPNEVDTAITVNSPDSVLQEETFNINGVLSRVDGQPIPAGQTVNLLLGTDPIGSAVTDANGNYGFNTQINVPGTFTLTAAFEGAQVAGLSLGPSARSFRVATPQFLEDIPYRQYLPYVAAAIVGLYVLNKI